jgi:hypothetical protein
MRPKSSKLVDIVLYADNVAHMARLIQLWSSRREPCAVNDEGTLSRFDLDESCLRRVLA